MPFKIYRSSAGSGKTFTLVKEYLRIALSSPRTDAYRGILAITFTNKAAEEMKQRVIGTLDELRTVENEDNIMAVLLQQEMGLPPEILADRASSVLRHMLHHYADISISTIDHFTHRVIRTFAQDLGISVNFEVELDTDRLKKEVVERLYERMAQDQELTATLIDVVRDNVDDEKTWSIDGTLEDICSVVFSEESRFHLNKLRHVPLEAFRNSRKELKKRSFANTQRIKELSKTMIQQLQAQGLSAADLYYGKKGIWGVFERGLKGETKPFNSYVEKFAFEEKYTSGKASDHAKVAVEAMAAKMIAAAEEIVRIGADRDQLELVWRHIHGIALLEEMQRTLNEIQEEEETLHIGEFNHLISEVVMKETAPFIYERIGARFDHFLVDEFQDTSVLQWFNLLPLIDESLAHDNLCLVVGDAKQSIYRWRGGDVQQFVELPDIHRPDHLQEKLRDEPELDRLLSDREKQLKSHARPLHLDTNYRSAETIVSFNNRLYTDLQQQMPETLGQMYDQAVQQAARNTPGLVDVRFLQPESRSWPEYDDIVVEQVFERISECLEDGFLPGDIAILTRKNDKAVLLARFLLAKGMKVVSNESLLINSSPKVRLLVNAAVFLLDGSLGVNNAELVQHLCMVRNETHLTSERLISTNPRNAQNADKGAAVRKLLAQLYPDIQWHTLRKASLYGLFKQLVHHLFPNDDESYIRYFLDEVLAFNGKRGNDLPAFLSHWKEKRHKLSIALTANRDAIRLLTIHKSKGLQFPVVIHPFADYGTDTARNGIWVRNEASDMKPIDRLRLTASSQLENTPFAPALEHERALTTMDMFNMLYVATTRPEKRLYLCGKLKQPTKSGKSEPATAIQFVHEVLLTQKEGWQDEATFVLGERIGPETSEDPERYLRTRQVGDPFWDQRVRISRPSREEWPGEDDPASLARKHGILVHDAMAHIRSEQDVEPALRTLLEKGRMSEDEQDTLREKVLALLHHPQLKPLFAHDVQVKNESDIRLADGRWMRPDRVVHRSDHAWVIDYKTGGEKAADRKQMNDYKEAMNQLGFKHVDALLVYMDEPRVETV